MILRSEPDDEYKAVQSIAFSPDGTMLAAGGKDSAARIWRVADGKLFRNFGRGRAHHSKWVNGVVFGSDSKSLISGSTDQTLRVWDIERERRSRFCTATRRASTQ
ncbi:MAG: hypothetical protein IPJ30_12895 [Acidobacteria bacterium]|nr:hypothetical protein [Acidobacteriota bacterium]